MTAILGISAFYHDSAAAIIIDGKIIAAAQEERFTRKKHDSSYPSFYNFFYCSLSIDFKIWSIYIQLKLNEQDDLNFFKDNKFLT